MKLKESFFIRYFFIICIILGVSLVSGLQGFLIYGQQIPALSYEDKIIIAEATHLWRELGNKVWHGWTSSSIPMIYIKKDYEYLVGYTSPPSEYMKLEHDSVLDSIVYFKKRELNENLATTWYVGDSKVVAIATPSELHMSPSQWILTAIHEMFHVYQGVMGSMEKVSTLGIDYGEDASWQLKFPFPYKDEILLKAIHTEANLAFIGITTDNEFECLYNSLSFLETVQIYKELIRLIYGDLKNYKYALFQEWTEGIAKYTEFKMVQLAAGENYKPLREFMDLDGYQSYRELKEDYYQKQFYAMRHCGKGVQGRFMFYYLGCAKGLLLDKVFPEWKKHYFTADIWLDDIFDLAVPEIQNNIVKVLKQL
jgi:hypothetical protein